MACFGQVVLDFSVKTLRVHGDHVSLHPASRIHLDLVLTYGRFASIIFPSSRRGFSTPPTCHTRQGGSSTGMRPHGKEGVHFMSKDRMGSCVAFISLFGSPCLYSTKKAFRLSADGTVWKEIHPETLLHGIVVGRLRFQSLLPPQAPEPPLPWSRMLARPQKANILNRSGSV